MTFSVIPRFPRVIFLPDSNQINSCCKLGNSNRIKSNSREIKLVGAGVGELYPWRSRGFYRRVHWRGTCAFTRASFANAATSPTPVGRCWWSTCASTKRPVPVRRAVRCLLIPAGWLGTAQCTRVPARTCALHATRHSPRKAPSQGI